MRLYCWFVGGSIALLLPNYLAATAAEPESPFAVLQRNKFEPVKPDPKDDKLQSLLKERYNAAASEMERVLELHGAQRGNPDLTDVLEDQCLGA